MRSVKRKRQVTTTLDHDGNDAKGLYFMTFFY